MFRRLIKSRPAVVSLVGTSMGIATYNFIKNRQSDDVESLIWASRVHAEAARDSILSNVTPTNSTDVIAGRAEGKHASASSSVVLPSRQEMLSLLKGKPKTESAGHSEEEDADVFDLLIIGGGATGVGCALDAQTRGLKTALVERDDFAAGIF